MATIFYDSDQVNQINNKHCVYNNNSNKGETKYYFDFVSKKWLKCHAVTRLPYNLCIYKIDDKENFVITCEDSYRLVDIVDNANLENVDGVPDYEQMLKEYEWREKIKENYRLQYVDKNGEHHNVVDVVVSWLKSDIIPNVACISSTKTAKVIESDCGSGFVSVIGYFYKESNSLMKNEETKNNKSDEMKEHLRLNDEFVKNKIFELNNELPFICPYFYSDHANKDYGFQGKFGCFDLRNYYKSLKFYTKPITLELIKNMRPSFDPLKVTNEYDLGMCGLVSLTDYDVVFTNVTTNIEKDIVLLDKFDAYFDIKIYGATYAYLYVKKQHVSHYCFSGDKKSDGLYDKIYDKIELDKIINESEEYFTFLDIELTNPIFKSVHGNSVTIVTDGKIINFNGILIQMTPFRIMRGILNSYSLSWFEKKGYLLMLGNFWQQSLICKIDDIIQIECNEIEK